MAAKLWCRKDARVFGTQGIGVSDGETRLKSHRPVSGVGTPSRMRLL